MNLQNNKIQKICPEMKEFVMPLTKDGFTNYPKENYAHFVCHISLNDYTMFTQDSETALIIQTSETIDSNIKITRGVMFQRKITAPIRRKMMSILRTYAEEIMTLYDLPITDTKTINRLIPDASLFGFAVSDSESNKRPIAFAGKSRILTGSGFTIRPLGDEITEYITGSSQSDKERIDKPSQGLWEKEHFKPEVVIPTIITLQNPTEEDISFLTYVLDKTKRFGAVSSRTGKGKITICGLFFSHEEFPSNLELSKTIYGKLKDKENISLSEIDEMVLASVEELCDSENIKRLFVSTDDLNSIYETIYATNESIENWVKEYSAMYLRILAELDIANNDRKITKQEDSELKQLHKDLDTILS